MTVFEQEPAAILARLAALREADAPTHGGRVLSYVYDSGIAELDRLAADAALLVQPVNGLDPTTFPSVAAMERELVGFARRMLHGDRDVVGTVTSGGTESCLLAVKTARDNWQGEGRPRLLAPVTVHAAFRKAVHYFGLDLELVPVDEAGRAVAADLVARMDAGVALVVVSAPSYPHAALDPIAEVAEAAAAAGIDCHVDACIGGWVLPWWGELPAWDFRVPGVTSISADLHKFGYAPKGASVLLHRGRDRQRAQFFATTSWPGYPVVNSSLLGSKSAGALAASWSIVQALGESGYQELTERAQGATIALIEHLRAIEGVRVVGDPVGPLFAIAADESVPPERRVDPHHLGDAMRPHGFVLQLQPGHTQDNGVHLPHTTHFTITPVTEQVLPELTAALTEAADAVRGIPQIDAAELLASLPITIDLRAAEERGGRLDASTSHSILQGLGLGGEGAGLPERLAPVLALVEALPAPFVERLLTELLARLAEPRD